MLFLTVYPGTCPPDFKIPSFYKTLAYCRLKNKPSFFMILKNNISTTLTLKRKQKGTGSLIKVNALLDRVSRNLSPDFSLIAEF